MNSDGLKNLLQKLPVGLLLILYVGYLGFDLYDFTYGTSSPLVQMRQQIEQTKQENVKTGEKLKIAQDFLRTLDLKKGQLRRMAEELDGMKATLTETLDVPSLMKMLVTEAKKIGLTVSSLRPTEASRSQFYAEQGFELNYRGVYVQLLVFLDRISKSQKVVRVEDFSMRPVGSSLSRYVELQGTVQIKAYHYIGGGSSELSPQSSAPSGGGT